MLERRFRANKHLLIQRDQEAQYVLGTLAYDLCIVGSARDNLFPKIQREFEQLSLGLPPDLKDLVEQVTTLQEPTSQQSVERALLEPVEDGDQAP
jgi:hypothetical protein